MNITTEIKRKLAEIERRENITILFAVESGSRAWGFASPDSDYDVRFVYVRGLEFYLQLEKRRDVLECELNDIYDINGWDLDKTLRLLHTSNPTLFEWASSPIIYKTTPFHKQFNRIAPQYFLSKSGLYHYLSMAEGNYREYLKADMVKLKKYFYVIRPLLACRWILKNNTPPPMLFSQLVEECLEERLQPIIAKLMDRKIAAAEGEVGAKILELNEWIETNITKCREDIKILPKENERDWHDLNQLFMCQLR